MAQKGKTYFASRFNRHCLNKVEERDVDLMVLEGLNCEPLFQDQIARLTLGLESQARFLEACNSVSTSSYGESDLIALYDVGGEVVAVMLENKIAAPFMPEQAARYRRRGEEGVNDGIWGRYVTCLIAPQSYLDGDHGAHVFDRYIAYETLLEHFCRSGAEPHERWRGGLIAQAIEGSRISNWEKVVDQDTSDFFREYWSYASRNFVALRMRPEKDRPAGNAWVQFQPEVELPKRISLWHKGYHGTVDISVSGCRVEDLQAAIGDYLGDNMRCEQTQKSAVVRFTVPQLVIRDGFAANHEKVRTALEAAERLRGLMVEHREAFLKL